MKRGSRYKFFENLANLVYKYYILILISVLVITFILGSLSEKIKLDMTWLGMAPSNSKEVISFQKLLNEFGGTSPIIIAIEGNDKNKLKYVAERIATDIKKLNKIKSINYKVDRNFIKKYGLLLQKRKDLKRMKNMVRNLNLTSFFKNINNDFEKEYINESDEPLSKQEKNAATYLDSLNDLLKGMNFYLESNGRNKKILIESINNFTFGKKYFISRDGKMILLFVQSTASVMNSDEIIPVVRKIEAILKKYRKENPDLNIGQTGMGVISRDEMDAAKHDTYFNLITAIIVILLLLAFSFRMITAPFLAMVSLIFGIVWDIGIAYLFVGRLNILTAMVGVILVGLGIDYSIHILTGYTQSRFKGNSVKDAIRDAYIKVGPGILTGALTTAIAFLVFLITDINLMKELGFVMGIGILTTFISTLFTLPALLILQHKIFKRKSNSKKKFVNLEYNFMENITKKVIKYPYIIIFITLILTVLSILLIPKLHFITDFRKLEMRGLTSIKLMDIINKKFEISPDPVVFSVNSLKESEEKTEKLMKLTSVGYVDSISRYLPPKNKQLKRIPYIKEINKLILNQKVKLNINKKELIKELKRLNDNIIELGDMAYMSGLDKIVKRCDEMSGIKNNKKVKISIFNSLEKSIDKSNIKVLTSLNKIFFNKLENNFLQMTKVNSILTLKKIPENIRQLYLSKDKKHYLIYVYSEKEIWKNLLNDNFLNDVKKIEPDVTGMAPIMKVVIEAAAKGGSEATLLSLIAVFLLVLIDFRNLRFTFISLVPLIVGSIWILGFLVISNIYFTWMTIMIIPLIIGIGIDDGVHIIHRYRIEGKGKLPIVLKTTGKAVILTSLTTMIGFGSLIFSKMVGYQQFGLSLFVGIGILLLLSTILLPAIIKITEK